MSVCIELDKKAKDMAVNESEKMLLIMLDIRQYYEGKEGAKEMTIAANNREYGDMNNQDGKKKLHEDATKYNFIKIVQYNKEGKYEND